MNRDLVLVYGMWRTGTNLLMSIFKKYGYLDLNEFFSLLSDNEEKIAILNSKLFDILCQDNLNKCTVKLILYQTNYIDDTNKNMFSKKFLVYRRDIFSSIISKVLAETRLNWYRSTYQPEQPKFFGEISKETLMDYADPYIFMLMNFIKSGHSKINFDYIINYEDDLIPYVAKNPTDSLPSSNYTITNLQELRELFDYSFCAEVKQINEFFDNLRKETNTVEFETLFN